MPKRERQDEVMAMVWDGVYKGPQLAGERYPPVRWITGSAIDCKANNLPGFQYEGTCYASAMMSDGVAWVVVPDGAKFSDTGFCHELYHQYIFYTQRGNMDYQHEDPGWKNWEQQNACIAALMKAGQ